MVLGFCALGLFFLDLGFTVQGPGFRVTLLKEPYVLT